MGTDPRRPVHLAVLLGVSTGAYAVALAAVTGLQSASDTAARRAIDPIVATQTSVGVDHGLLERDLRDATARYSELADQYDRFTPRLLDLEAALDSLAGSTQRITDGTAALPTRISLPPVRRAPQVVAAAPRTHAVTSASGG
ncbi:MAG TPA: hypothetical protein VFI69_01365 [Candidatus Limnocylindrales bacterium]|jgi:hypothetical protein|nr:hypothetical protein [Candidatus Limnocylindrales bacterium]